MARPLRSLLAFLGLTFWLSGCAPVTVVPPADPVQPVPVFLLDHGRHSSLVVPTPSGALIRYSYGDWEYYALGRTSLARGLAALLAPTPAALGRRELPGPPGPIQVRRQVRVGIEQLFSIDVAEADVARLGEQLDGLYQAGRPTRVYSAAMDLDFVHHPAPYTLRHNSNRMVAEWLRVLGCEVRGQPVLSDWRLEALPGRMR